MQKHTNFCAFFVPQKYLAASAAEVTSDNVVGYTKIQLAEGLNMIGSQFLNVGGTTKDINEFIVDGSDLLGLDANWAYQTTMLVWNGVGYETYGWFDGDDGTSVGDPIYNSKWGTVRFAVASGEGMDLSKGVWINTPIACTITTGGEVSAEETLEIQINAGLNIIANPFPCDVSIQEIQTDLPGLDANWAYQTTMLVWNGVGYDTYGWFDGDDGTSVGDPTYNSKWGTVRFGIADKTLKVGEAFWINAPAAGKVTFTK